nr:cupin domain-containing protein [Bdellovibrionales bacterium]
MMKKGTEQIYKGDGFTIYHQNIPKKQLKTHFHNEAHLFIPLEGHLELEVKDTVYKVNAGKMIFISGSVPHSFNSTSEAGDRIIVQFDEALNKKFKGQKGKVVLLPTHPLIKNLILDLFPYAHSKFATSMGELVLEILIENLTLQTDSPDNIMFRIQEKVLTADHPDIQKLVKLMETEMSLSLDEIATGSGLSKRTLTRLVQEEIGLSPKEFYTFFRIQK